MSKGNLLNFFITCLLATSVFFFVGCKKDDPNNPSNSVPDPEGTVTANISESTYFTITANVSLSSYSFCGCEVSWMSPDNIKLRGFYGAFASICNVGKINGLGNITKIPNTGYTMPDFSNVSMSCEEGHGYVIKFGAVNSGEIEALGYARMYVVEPIISTSGGVMGAKVKYQYPFEP